MPRLLRVILASSAFYCASAQVIEFENGGLRYQSLTKRGVTIMCARLPGQLKQYAMVQVAISNGSDAYAMVKPEDFVYQLSGGSQLTAVQAREVVTAILDHGGHSDLVKLVTTYENAIYRIPNLKVRNSYEQRRQSALAEGTSGRFKAAAAAAAIALVPSRIPPGQSTDGAVFFPVSGKNFPQGRIVVHAGGDTFEFNAE